MGQPRNIDTVEFVRMWLAGESVREMAAAFEVSAQSIYQLCTTLRKAGVALPPRRLPTEIDAAALNDMIKRHNKSRQNGK